MKNYEGLFILKPDMAKEELSQMYQSIHNAIKKHKGEVSGADEWGEKQLSFKLKKQRKGVYYLLRFKTDPSQIALLNSEFKLNEAILRVMFT